MLYKIIYLNAISYHNFSGVYALVQSKEYFLKAFYRFKSIL
ncbi:MAG: hypothetical protein BAJALOKI1v1_490004 [Promethearchaeota archaeon]|nr:MAG: hypothetical protein BAJALOKI1v1_490004 [Candidatus Lokiarchaeota archaeon]